MASINTIPNPGPVTPQNETIVTVPPSTILATSDTKSTREVSPPCPLPLDVMWMAVREWAPRLASRSWRFVARPLSWRFIKVEPINGEIQLSHFNEAFDADPEIAKFIRAAYISLTASSSLLRASRYARATTNIWALPNLRLLSLHNFDFNRTTHHALESLYSQLTQLRMTKCSFSPCLVTCKIDQCARAGPQLKVLMVECPMGLAFSGHTQQVLVALAMSPGVEELFICAPTAELVIPMMVEEDGAEQLTRLETRVTAAMANSLWTLLLMRPKIHSLNFGEARSAFAILSVSSPTTLRSFGGTFDAFRQFDDPTTLTNLTLRTSPPLHMITPTHVIGIPFALDSAMRAGKLRNIHTLELHIVNWFPELLKHLFKHMPNLEHISVFALQGFHFEQSILCAVLPALSAAARKRIRTLRVRQVTSSQVPMYRYRPGPLHEHEYALSVAKSLAKRCPRLEEMSSSVWFTCRRTALGTWRSGPIDVEHDRFAYRLSKALARNEDEIHNP